MVGKLSNYFASLSIFICCLGLLGLAMFTADQRRKEISIRKLLGASFGTLFRLLSMEILTLVIIAFLIAIPISWMAMHRWLQDYAYHSNISWWLFAAAGLFALMIALVTVSFHAAKTSLINPVKSLMAE